MNETWERRNKIKYEPICNTISISNCLPRNKKIIFQAIIFINNLIFKLKLSSKFLIIYLISNFKLKVNYLIFGSLIN